MKFTEITLNQANETYLDIYDSGTQENLPAIIVVPGGGYKKFNDFDSEKVAISFLTKGFQAFVIRYAVGEYKDYQQSIQAVNQSVDYIVEHADDLHVRVDQLGMIGLSAGGQLAARYSNTSNNRLRYVVLGYPVITKALDQGMGVATEDVSLMVNENTVPTFIFGSRDDTVTPYMDHIHPYEKALYENNVAFEVHIYSTGGHAYSLANQYTGNGNQRIDHHFASWFPLFMEWVQAYL